LPGEEPRKKNAYALDMVSDTPAVVTHFGSVASVLSAAAGTFRRTTWSKSAAKWVNWDKKLQNICLNTTKYSKCTKKILSRQWN